MWCRSPLRGQSSVHRRPAHSCPSLPSVQTPAAWRAVGRCNRGQVRSPGHRSQTSCLACCGEIQRSGQVTRSLAPQHTSCLARCGEIQEVRSGHQVTGPRPAAWRAMGEIQGSNCGQAAAADIKHWFIATCSTTHPRQRFRTHHLLQHSADTTLMPNVGEATIKLHSWPAHTRPACGVSESSLVV